jgi:hypothetical protein
MSVTRRVHRMLVDRIASSRWLRGRAGTDAKWAHYEHHARAWKRSADRHASARDAARQRAARGPARTLPRWQAAISRLIGHSTVRTPGER